MLTESKWGIHISSSATIYVLVTSVINPHKMQRFDILLNIEIFSHRHFVIPIVKACLTRMKNVK